MPEAEGSPDPVATLRQVVTSMGGSTREGQERMTAAVWQALTEGESCLIQAGTGTGKSLGYLVPAALSSRAQGMPVVVATATVALQRQLVMNDLPLVSESLNWEDPLRFTLLKGRNNYVCLHKLHGGGIESEGTDELFDSPTSHLEEQALRVREWAESTPTGDRDDFPGPIDARVWRGVSVTSRECLGDSGCSFAEECFANIRRAQAHEADIVVTNHALLAIAATESLPLLPEHRAVIIDEAHELVDRITSAVTVELSANEVQRAFGRAGSHVDTHSTEQAEGAVHALRDALLEQDAGTYSTLPNAVTLALTLVRDASHQLISVLSGRADGLDESELAKRQIVRAAIEDVNSAAGAILGRTERDVVWIAQHDKREPILSLAPLTVEEVIGNAVVGERSAIFTSATLTVGGGFGSAHSAFGLESNQTQHLDVGSPFDYSSQGILYVAAHLPPPGRDGIPMEALDELAELIEAAQGRTLALFSSWRGVERASEYLNVRLSEEFPLLVQQRGDAVAPLIAEFTAVPTSVLLGTISLWQGVDVTGGSCIQVIIDRIPFSHPDDPLASARSNAVDASGGSGFFDVSVPRAATLMAQGAGRLIRSETDRGVVSVLDSRLANARYGGTIRKSMPPLWFTTDSAVVKTSLSRLAADSS